MKRKKFSFSKVPPLAPRPKRKARAEVIRDPKDEPPFYVRGMRAASRDEYWVSLALDKIEKETGWSWEYQVPVYGGRKRRGGNVIDFLVHTPGRYTALDPMGRYWHTGAREDQVEMETVTRRKNWRLVAWFTDETPSKDLTYSFLRKQFYL